MHQHETTVIGLGVMGQRMLRNMTRYGGFRPVVAWDPDGTACRRAADEYPTLRIADSAAEAMGDPATRVVYVASPPVAHREHALAAIAAGKAVYCEKPLGVDVAESRALADAAEDAGIVNIVNFSLASAVATEAVEAALAKSALGEIAGVEIIVRFAQWPRAWQMDAASWLARRAEGGFTREVLSHWVYLTERLLGPATLERSFVRFPPGDAAETHLQASLTAAGVPVTVTGTVGGAGPDRVEFTVYGAAESYRIEDWNRLATSDGGAWRQVLTHVEDPREAGYARQLANAARAVAGETHGMPDFRAALSVQTLIEAMLAGA